MKNLIKILSAGLLITALFSCNDLLDNVQPSQSISQQQALSTQGGVEALRISMYDRLHSFGYSTEYMLAPDALADNLTSREGTTRFTGKAQNDDGNHVENWDGNGIGPTFRGNGYDLINDANLLINAIPDGVLDDATRDQFRGEAFMLRAFAYHHLVRTFGYEPGVTPSTGAGAGFNLGVIIRTTPTLDASDASFRPRATVQQVYDLIISDLQQSISLLSQGDAGDRTFATVAAAEALMARVHLYARNYEEADQFATDALNSTTARLAQPEEVATMFDETTGLNPEPILLITTDPNTESIGVNNAVSAYTSQQWGAMIPTQDLMNLYSEKDARLALYRPCFNELEGEPFSNCIATHPAIEGGSEGLEIAKWAAELNQFADNYPHFRVSEMLLIQAEARLNTGGDALSPLNTLRAARGLEPLGSIDLEEILNERRRELVAEGHRFFDLKRLGRTIRKAPETVGGNTQDVPFSDFRVLDNIPDAEVSLSQANAPADSVLIQNPGHEITQTTY